jgi:acyl-CoA thioesterase FadM
VSGNESQDGLQQTRLLEWRVSEDQIDHNGHVGTNDYALKGGEASLELLRRLGMNVEDLKTSGTSLRAQDSFVRYYREQTLGASLVMKGGVVAVEPDTLTVYHELHNQDNGELSAVVTQRLETCDVETREPRNLPGSVVSAASEHLVTVPEHGRPRSLDLTNPGSRVSSDELEKRGLGVGQGGFGAPGPYKVEADLCDPNGYLEVALGLGFTWLRRPSREEIEKDPKWVRHMRMVKERKTGWVALESRMSLFSTPRAGDELRNFSAVVARQTKTRHRMIWTFNLTSGALACIHQQVDLAFDLANRKGIEITEDLLGRLGERFEPDLA